MQIKISHLFIEATRKTLLCLILFILFLEMTEVAYKGTKELNSLFFGGIILYLLIIFLIKGLFNRTKLKLINSFISIITLLGIIYYIISRITLQYHRFYIFYLIAIMILAILSFKQEDKSIITIRDKYILSFLLLITLLWSIKNFAQGIKIYFPLYLIMCLLSFIHEKIFKEYSDTTANIINEKRNKEVLNRSLVFISCVIIIFFTTDFYNNVFFYMKNFFSRASYFILKPISKILTLFYKYVLYKAVNWGGDAGELVNPIGVVFIWIIVGWCILLFIYSVILKKNVKLRKEYLGMWDSIRDSFITCMEKLSVSTIDKEKRERVRNLNQIRRIYIDLVKILSKKGIDYDNTYTPNEYKEVIKNTELKDTDVSEIIEMYNEVRYGDKSISKEDIARAYRIKKNMKKNLVHSSCK